MEVSSCRFASFRVPGVALRDFQTFFVTCRKLFCVGRRNTFATFSEDALQSFVAGAALWTCPSFIWRGRRSALEVSCCVSCANRIGRAASSGDEGADFVASVTFCEICDM